MPEYIKHAHKTKRSAEAIARTLKKAGVKVRVIKVTGYRVVRTK